MKAVRVAVEILGVVGTDEVDGLVIPRGVVEQVLPDRPGLIELLEDQAFLPARIVDRHAAVPATPLDLFCGFSSSS
jgi:hypothetical protein